MGLRSVRLGPVALTDGVLTMRTPRLRDAAAWSAARLENRTWLEAAFPAWGDDWAAEQSEAAWVQRCLRLRVAAWRGRAKPFVLLLDGRLIGELGVDAVDEVSGGGEASVWMVRAHGSADVMGAASLLLIQHAFTAAHPLDRLVSPVATTSRKGRSPGLTAAGLRIEATVPRRVGAKGFADHDIWVVHNTAADRDRVAALLTRFAPAAPPDEPATRLPVAAVIRAAVRTGRAALRRARRGGMRHGGTAPVPRVAEAGISLRARRAGSPGSGWQIVRGDEAAGAVVGTVHVDVDAATATAEIRLSADHDRAALRAALHAVARAVEDGWFGAVLPAVRVPRDPAGRVVPDEEMLTWAGFRHVATFPGNPEGPHHWAGEQRWEGALPHDGGVRRDGPS